MRWVPRSLFGRILAVLLIGLAVAQLVSLAIFARERGELLVRTSGGESAQRIADIVRLLESLDGPGRRQVAKVLAQPPLSVSLDRAPLATVEPTARSVLFARMVGSYLGGDWRVEAALVDEDPTDAGPVHGPGLHGAVMHGSAGGPPFGLYARTAPQLAYVAQVRLHDGTLVTFDARHAQPDAAWPYRVLASLAVLLLAVVLLASVVVRWATRPLATLAAAADRLGRDIDRPAVPERGPVEVVRAAQAFNRMQARLSAYLRERTAMLAAMSHDLKTPVTRLRLRAELLADPQQRAKFTDDLAELEAMLGATLDYLRGAERAEAVQPVDVAALLDSIQADVAETGGQMSVAGHAQAPYPAQPTAFKRCVRNIVENAIRYGRRAHVDIVDGPQVLQLRVRDEGPGLPEDELDRVFDPFYRVEGSRSRQTGGSGLGLTIARSIAQLHGGTLTLHNHPQGGLEARLVLPRATAAQGSSRAA